MFIVSLVCVLDFDILYDQATTGLVNYQALKDSAVATFIALGRDSSTGDTVVSFLVSKFDTKSAAGRHTLKNILTEIGEVAIEEIVLHIDNRGSDAEARALKQCLWILGEIGGEQIVAPVARFINDTEWSVRSGAFTALGKSGSRTALPYVCEGLNDTVAPVRKSAYCALAEIATKSEVAYLVEGLDDPFYGVRYAALDGLRRVGCGLSCLGPLSARGLKDYFSVSLRTGSDTIPGFDDLIWSTPPSVRKAVYGRLSKEEMLIVLKREGHPLLIKYLQKRIAEANSTEP
jgi:HEAT repeat protein